jgi:putative ABC transport system permease protein
VTIAALATGLVLGVVYGWAGAQSLLGSVPVDVTLERTAHVVWPSVPFWPVVAIVVATTVLTLVAAVVPTRLATRVAPVEALAE